MDKKKILLVDDKAMLRDALVEYLGTDEYDILEAETGEKAMELFMDEDFDVVILDHNLPGMDGYKLLQLMKKAKAEIPVIGLTGELTIEIREKYLSHGAYDIHAKSAIYEKLIPTLNAALSGFKPEVHPSKKANLEKIAEALKDEGRWEESAMYLREAGIEQKALGNIDRANDLFEESISRYIRAGRRSKALEVEQLLED
jgi:DNA-binding response OmpR family regulator